MSNKRKAIGLTFIFLIITCIAFTGCAQKAAEPAQPAAAQVTAAPAAITIIDDVGREISLEKPLERVVVFNKFNSEIIRSLGKVGTIVGTDKNSLQDKEYWPGWNEGMLAGNSQTDIDYEKVAELKPDAVILPKNGAYEECEKKLTPFGIKVIVITGWENTSFAKQIEIAGKAFAREEKAKEYIGFCQKQVDLLAAALKSVDGQKTVYLENSGEYKTCLPGSGWNDMITMAGGRNLFGDVDFANEDQAKGSVHSFSVDPEEIITRNPSAILLNVYDSKAIKGTSVYIPPDPDAANEALLALTRRPGWKTLGAVKDNSIYGISAFCGNGCFKIAGATYLAKFLYPEAMAGIDPDVFMTEWLEKYQDMPFQPGHTMAVKVQ
ncbi:MAG TPA: ABC transporter substrate-binding protein [Clostridia bacterium]|nr:ABC transporter substrate-binding protein [Clostridia bacterium]